MKKALLLAIVLVALLIGCVRAPWIHVDAVWLQNAPEIATHMEIVAFDIQATAAASEPLRHIELTIAIAGANIYTVYVACTSNPSAIRHIASATVVQPPGMYDVTITATAIDQRGRASKPFSISLNLLVLPE